MQQAAASASRKGRNVTLQTRTPGSPVVAERAPRRLNGGPRWGRVLPLLPFFVFAVAFGAYPAIQLVQMAFSHVTLANGAFTFEWVGALNLVEILENPAAWQAIGNTLIFVAGSTIGSLFLGTVLALLVDRSLVVFPVARNVFVWPAVIAPVVVSLIWLLILSPTAGGLNKVLGSFGVEGQQWINNPAEAMSAIIILDIWHWSPVVFLFIYTALKAIDPSLLEAARIDGSTEGQVLRYVTLPLLGPAIGAVIIIRVIMGVKAFDEMYLLTGGGPNGATTLVSLFIKNEFFDALNFGSASTYSLLIITLTALVLGIFLFARSRLENRP